MKLSKVDCSRGAPMGRPEIHRTGITAPHFELEYVPFVDDCYDAGGAYFGLPANLYAYEFVTPLTQTVIVQGFIRADSRASAMEKIREDYPEATFQVENGSLIEQMIEHLQEYLKDCDADFVDDTEAEIAALEDELDIINHRKEHGL